MLKNTDNKKYKGAVFFDIDGTLVDERLGIVSPTAATKDAMKKLKQNGYLVGVATGRSKGYMSDLGIDFNCHIYSNGAVVESDGVVIVNESIPPEELDRLVDFLNENKFSYDVETYDRCYYSAAGHDLLVKFLETFSVDYSDFKPFESSEGLDVNKIVIAFDDTEMFEKLAREFEGEFVVHRHHGYNSGEVCRLGISKATGIQAVIKCFGIDIQNTYAFGDDENDVDMLSAVGCGIAMTPHSPKLDGVAKRFTLGVGEDGVAKALTELGLI